MEKKYFNRYYFQIILFAALFLFQTGNLFANEQNDTIEANVPKAFRLSEIGDMVSKAKKYFVELKKKKESFGETDLLDSTLTVFTKKLKLNEKVVLSQNPGHVSNYFIESTLRQWALYKKDLKNWKSEIEQKLNETNSVIEEMEYAVDSWKLTLDEAREKNIPLEVRTSINNIIKEYKGYLSDYNKQEKKLLVLLNKISENMVIINNVSETINGFQTKSLEKIFAVDAPPIWKLPEMPERKESFVATFTKIWKDVLTPSLVFFKDIEARIERIIFVFLLVFGLFFWYRKRFIKAGLNSEIRGYEMARRVFVIHPVKSFISILLFFTVLLGRNIPLVFLDFTFFIVVILILHILPVFVGRQEKKLIFPLVVIFILSELEIIFWNFSLIYRYYVLFEIITAFLLTFFVIRPRFKTSITSNTSEFYKYGHILSNFLLYVFGFAVIANIFGFLSLSQIAMQFSVNIMIVSIVTYGMIKVLTGLVIGIILVGRSQKRRFFDNYWDVLEKRIIQIIVWGGVAIWIVSILNVFHLTKPFFDWLFNFLSTKWTIGTLKLSLGGLFMFIIILFVTYYISKFTKLVIEQGVLKKSNLSKGVVSAVSVTIRYFITILGIILALSAVGIDLSQFGLVAGALGVGIGFGMQNIVNNFISGLILIYERPIEVGDTIEVGNLLGQVNNIGIRASNVRTYDGSEVVVPNANLISNELINWTLSDNKRRIDLRIGVAYGSDPNKVIELLKSVPMSHENVLKDPEPAVYFNEFGDSSLNFRVLFWVPYDVGLSTKSDVAIGIYNILKENDITIPFPQLDLHMKKEVE
jgi:small-conductance mechanosensitive channel